MTASSSDAFLIYDGDCPFCRNYTSYVKVTKALPGLRLISARDGGDEVEEAKRRGIDLDQQMISVIDGRWLAGENAMAELARRAQRFRTANHLWGGLMAQPRLGRFLYNRLVQGRLLTLRLLGKKKIFPGNNKRPTDRA
jgi:predicted DCC family thiol-disulfide oxidoreductase YuxK